MTDELGMRKAGRRRRTTRRMTRRPIRVPGDDVPRSRELDDEADAFDAGVEADEIEITTDRTSSDMIDVDLEVDGADGPTSGVMSAPASDAAPAMPTIDVSVRESAPPDEKTNPQIRLDELGAAPESAAPVPPPPSAAREPDEPTRPRIELSDMVMSAVRASQPPPARASAPPSASAEEGDVDTNPRIPISIDEDSPVIVTRARVISDLPPSEGEAGARSPTRSSVRPPPPSPPSSTAPIAPDDVDGLMLDDEGPSKLVLPAAPPASVGPRPPSPPGTSAEPRTSKAPPPPPPGAASAEPVAKLPVRKAAPNTGTHVLPNGAPLSLGPQPPAVPAAASQGPQPPAAALKAPPPPPPPPGTAKKTASVVAAVPKGPKRRSWWEDFFSDEYLQSVIRPTPAQIAHQVDFIESSLGLSKGATLLDIGCGVGLHALELARRGYLVVGLDLSLPMITRAAESAQQEGLRINFLHTDLREIAFQGMFDALICWGTTFGFFDDDTNRDVLARMCAALKPGGKMLLDVANRDHVIGSQPNLVWFEGEGCVVMEESDFNYFSSRLVVKRTTMRDDGRQNESEYSIRLYALHELGQMMQQAGLRVSEVSGLEATRGVFFGAVSTRVILLGERRAKAPVAAVPNAAPAEGSDKPDKPT